MKEKSLMNIIRYAMSFVSLIAVARVCSGQSIEQSPHQNQNTRTISIYAGIGFLELIVLGVQYQINDEFAFGVKTDAALVGGHDRPGGGLGGGFKGSYFFNPNGKGTFVSMNVLNVEVSYLFAGTSRGVWRRPL
jgi:hypothetical protein